MGIEVEAEAGERWAYRERGRMPLAEVTVLMVGTQSRSPKVKIRFEADEYEGRVEWVPFKRLRCRWEDRETFLTVESKWDAVAGETGGHQRHIFRIAETVFYTLELDDICWLGEKGYADIFYIQEPITFEGVTGVSLNETKQNYRHVEEGGELYISPAAVVVLAKQVARKHPAGVMKYVREIELQAELDRVLDAKQIPFHRVDRYEVTMEIYGEEIKHLRRWAGEAAETLSDQLCRLQNELEVVTALLNESVLELREEGRKVKAGRLRSKYLDLKQKARSGEPVERLRMWIDTPPERRY